MDEMNNNRTYVAVEQRTGTEQERITRPQDDNANHVRVTTAMQRVNGNLRAENASMKPVVESSIWSTLSKILTCVLVAGSVGGVGYGVYAYFSGNTNTGNIPKLSRDVIEQPNYSQQASNIFRSFEDRFGAFVRAGAVEDFGIVDNENESSRSWRGRKVFSASGSGAGVIAADDLISALTSRLRPDTLETSDDGTKFLADIRGISDFSPYDIIRSSFRPENSLTSSRAEKFISQESITREIEAGLTYSTGSYGYARFIMKTSLPNVSIMAVFSLDPNDPQHYKKSYLLAGNGYIDGRKAQDIESAITINSDIYTATFTVKSGSISGNDSFDDCLRKFVQQFAE